MSGPALFVLGLLLAVAIWTAREIIRNHRKADR